MSQDGDSLVDVLQPYLKTGVNLTTFRFRYEGSAADSIGDLTSTGADSDRFAIVHDSLLTLYHGVRLRSRDVGGCQWAGNNLLPTLAKVSVTFERPSFCCYDPFVWPGSLMDTVLD